MQRKALGRGLSSLLREVDTTTSGLDSVAVDLIDPSPLQPRRVFPEEGLKELTDSIRSTGVVQPVLLRRSGGRRELKSPTIVVRRAADQPANHHVPRNV